MATEFKGPPGPPEERELSVEEIKRDLRKRCGEIEPVAWVLWMPDMQIPLYGIHFPSTVLSLYRAGSVEGYLARNGLIFEKLVRYVGETGPDKFEKMIPDEVLGEASDERYRENYQIACEKLEWLYRKTGILPQNPANKIRVGV